jgi:hypothetical protein
MTTRSPGYLMWWDGAKKRHPRDKLLDGVEFYAAKFGERPCACLTSIIDAEQVNAAEAIEDITVVGKTHIQRNTFYLGRSTDGNG